MMKTFKGMGPNNQRIAVIGLSHLGLVSCLGLASLNQMVLALDKNKKLVENLNNQRLPVYEPGLNDLLKENYQNLQFSSNFSDLSRIDTILFSQDTETGTGSTKKLEQLINYALPYVNNQVTIICMSQVPIGYYRKLEVKIKQALPNLKFDLYHLVDTIIMTNAVERFLNPERIIIGSGNNRPYSPQLQSFLSLFNCPTFSMSYESAELTKAAINVYLANTVTFANTLSDFCESFGADINEIIPALKTDKRIGPYAYLRPGLRIAGGHLERDLIMLKRLSRSKKISSGVVNFILKENAKRYLWVEDKLNKYLFRKIKKPTICIWGLSYKKDSESTHNAASIKIIRNLSVKAKLHVYDPMAILPKKLQGYIRFEDKYKALKDADCLLLLTEWDEFATINPNKVTKLMRNSLIVDGVGIAKEKLGASKKLTYLTMGISKLGSGFSYS